MSHYRPTLLIICDVMKIWFSLIIKLTYEVNNLDPGAQGVLGEHINGCPNRKSNKELVKGI